MIEFNQLKKNLKKDFLGKKVVKIALMGDTSTQLLVQALRAYGFNEGFDLQIWEADFDQVERQVFDSTSELYNTLPDIIILFESSHKLLSKYNKSNPEKHIFFATDKLKSIKSYHDTIIERSKAKIIYYNFSEIDDSVYGNYANKTETSFLFQLRKLNYLLMEFGLVTPGFYLCDISSIQNNVGKGVFFMPSMYVNTEMVVNIDILPLIAARTVSIIGALFGKFKKCVILDLDNTIWGGVIGDDGVENIQLGSLGIGKAFTEFQYWLKKLKNRGIILAVCSKNTESIAKEPFEKHPDMVLKLSDISVFMANWDTKVENIRQIQQVLNIGFDSIVFIDDNPFERNMVKENIEGILVPELPADPASYLEYLYEMNLFETVSYSKEDSERTKLYQVAAERNILQKSFANEQDFLQSLNMVSVIEPFNKFNTPRVAQLTQRSNQYNLRTVRFSELDIQALRKDIFFTFSFTLEDKFGDNGLICVVILEKDNSDTFFINTWLMSCRVLKRGMENFVLNTISKFTAEHGFKYLKGEYIPTSKNEIVKDHYQKLGFEPVDGTWVLDIQNYVNKTCHIIPKNNYINE